MIKLPIDFENSAKALMGDGYTQFRKALDSESPVSIRLNPFKIQTGEYILPDSKPVPWCKDAYYLNQRPQFTFDPLFHAGVYYVQEASSMFIDTVIRQYVTRPVTMLDLCAAPGGKTTCARAALPSGSVLFSNEPISTRANILAENVQKFGHPDVIVTNNYPKDYRKAEMHFDIVLADVPCSGEGMFRKDAGAIAEWSLNHVGKCMQLQRSIVEDIWPCLDPGGILIYSTCTYNRQEDEDNVQWIANSLGADIIAVETDACWGIKGSFTELDIPVSRFIPGYTCGEGLFMAVLCKHGAQEKTTIELHSNDNAKRIKNLHVLSHGINPPQMKGRKEVPDTSLSLTILQKENQYPKVEVDYLTAIAYLRREAIILPSDAPRGIVTISYQGYGLGFANNLGNRANNLYPQEWRIKSTHLPEKVEVLNIKNKRFDNI